MQDAAPHTDSRLPELHGLDLLEASIPLVMVQEPICHLAFAYADSNTSAFSKTVLKVRLAMARRLHCRWSSWMPHTRQSRSMSSSEATYPHDCANSRRHATNAANESPLCRVQEFKRNRITMAGRVIVNLDKLYQFHEPFW